MKIGVPETIRKENFQDFFSFSKPKLNENLKFNLKLQPEASKPLKCIRYKRIDTYLEISF